MSADGSLRDRELADAIVEAGERTLALTDDLDDEQRIGPYSPIVNPLLWEVGHAAWFYSFWPLRNGIGAGVIRADEDALYDSIAIPHHTRRQLPLPSWQDTLSYVAEVREAVLDAVGGGDERLMYLAQYALHHEDMHAEAYTYTRQTLGYAAPELGAAPAVPGFEPAPGDVEIPGCRFRLGPEPGSGFVFDNEKWGHEIAVDDFAISRTAVSRGELLAFVEDDGYRRRELWSHAGWTWLMAADREAPRYWRKRDGVWQRRAYDGWIELDTKTAAIHVGYYEAEAYCRWAGRRLPTEAEWELAAIGEPGGGKRRFPWGAAEPTPELANLDAARLGTIDVHALPAGDSPWGCRQMIGNVWEWTSTDFGPYPGYVRDMYAEYSEPWFSGHKVLRGGAFSTRSRMIRGTWRNFYTPNRDDVMVGFRTCASR